MKRLLIINEKSFHRLYNLGFSNIYRVHVVDPDSTISDVQFLDFVMGGWDNKSVIIVQHELESEIFLHAEIAFQVIAQDEGYKVICLKHLAKKFESVSVYCESLVKVMDYLGSVWNTNKDY